MEFPSRHIAICVQACLPPLVAHRLLMPEVQSQNSAFQTSTCLSPLFADFQDPVPSNTMFRTERGVVLGRVDEMPSHVTRFLSGLHTIQAYSLSDGLHCQDQCCDVRHVETPCTLFQYLVADAVENCNRHCISFAHSPQFVEYPHVVQ